MAKRAWIVIALLAVSLSWPGKAYCQSTSPETLAAAKELMVAMRASDQMNLLLPVLMQQFKPLVVQNHPERERDFDSLMPIMTALMNERMQPFLNSLAEVYARHFTVDEMRQMSDFFKHSAGRKFLEKQPEILQETVVAGRQFGQAVAGEIQKRLIEEMRKRGHNI